MLSFIGNLRKAASSNNENEELTQQASTDVLMIKAQVKATTSMINRIQQGHSFSIVIGLDIETALYRTPPELSINTLIQPLREAFIFNGTGINAINGKQLLQHMQDNNQTEYPFAIDSLPAASDIQVQEINKQLTKIFSRINTVYNLISNESAHTDGNSGEFIKFIEKISFINQAE